MYIFVEINALLSPWEKSTQNVVYFCNFEKNYSKSTINYPLGENLPNLVTLSSVLHWGPKVHLKIFEVVFIKLVYIHTLEPIL
jgi:hypothetical protein